MQLPCHYQIALYNINGRIDVREFEANLQMATTQ